MKEDSEVISGLRLDFDLATQRAEELGRVVCDRDAQLGTLKSEKDGLTSRVDSLEKELQRERDNVKDKVELAACSATIETEWRLVKEYKLGKAPTWDAKTAETNYREYMILNAKANGREPPVFPESLTEDPSSASVPQPVAAAALANNHPQDII